jgi:hypothetical protein
LVVTIDGEQDQFALDGSSIDGFFQIADGGHSVVLGAPDPLSLTAAGNSASFIQGGSAVIVDGGLTISDSAAASLTSATVSVASGFLAGDVLSANTVGTSISASYDAATGSLTLTA